jgi:Rrf2 family nitric oxide-sensitive transcriptional repressor
MHLTQFSDYALRISLYLACHDDRLVSVDEIAKAYKISRNHLVKVVQTLVEIGVVEAHRGRGGGMRLGRPASEINVGWLVRQAEPHFNLVECFDDAKNTCPISPACGLKGVLIRAQRAFLDVLDGHTLDEFQSRRAKLIPFWEATLAIEGQVLTEPAPTESTI